MNAAAFSAHSTPSKTIPIVETRRSSSNPTAIAIALAAQHSAKQDLAALAPNSVHNPSESQSSFPVMHAAPSEGDRQSRSSNGSPHRDQITTQTISVCASAPADCCGCRRGAWIS